MPDKIVSTFKKSPKISASAGIIMLVGLGIAAAKLIANDNFGRGRNAA